MSNQEIAARLHELAALLELKGVEGYRLRSYRRAAASIEGYPAPLTELYAQRALQQVPGVGDSFARKIEEIIEKGTCAQLEELRAEFAPAVMDLMRVPGVGPKTALLVWQHLKVDDLDSLSAAAADGSLAALPGLGPKRAAAVLAGIESVRRWGDRTPVAVAWPIAAAILRELRSYPEVLAAEAAGSLRRGRESIGDLDIVIATDVPAEVLARFASLPSVVEALALGDTKASLRLRTIRQVDLRAVSPRAYAAALLYFTGSREHNVRLRQLARSKGLRLNEYGLFSVAPGDAGDPEDPLSSPPAALAIDAADEAAIYAALGMDYVPPELREDRGEVESAIARDLPRLIQPGELRGDLHAHTRWTDGTDTIGAMAEAAADLGLSYLAITDHSQALAFTGGLTPEKLAEQGREIVAWRERHPGGVRLLHGCEVEILPDGRLDLPDEALASLDWVVAAVHSPNRRTGLDLTSRLVRAAEHPLVDVIAHPTGQIVGARDAYELDWPRLLAAAAAAGVALEINASPHRLDLPPELARQAAARGVKLVISTDAHDARSLSDLHFGVTAARRGWLRAADVLNTLTWPELAEWRLRRRGHRPGDGSLAGGMA
jgi:DNA polymerase (family 10)